MKGSGNKVFFAKEDAGTLDTVTMRHRVAMMQQICQGMEKLAKEGIIHRDLAARNVLLFHYDPTNPAATSVKVTDFGLSVGISGCRTHATVQGNQLPDRYLSPEAIQRRRFSEKSDVWAFGVTMWEILTNGNHPYALVTDSAILAHVFGGGRLSRPDDCPEDLWSIVQQCWATSPADRPTFAEVGILLGQVSQGPVKKRKAEEVAQDEAQRKADQEREAFDTAKNNGDCVGIVRLLAEVTAADVHRHGCRRVWEMIQPTRETSLEDANKEHEKDLVTAGALEAVIQCMQTHPGQVGVQAEGCFALRCLTDKSAYAVRVAEAGGIDVILAAMAQHRDSTEVQEYGCYALENVACNNDANGRTIAEKGGIDAILAAMKHDSTGVQEHGCIALVNVAGNVATQRSIAEKGGIDVILAGMKQHSDSTEVQREGCYALAWVARNNDESSGRELSRERRLAE